MPQIINTNIASLNAQRNLNKSQSANQTALQRLSSGLRINSAKDDAAGLAISTRFNSQIRGLNVAVRNAGDGISLAQTAEGALGSMNDNLQRIRELAVQSANATNSDVDREALQAEVEQLVSEVSRTADETEFNGRKLLDGSFSAIFQIGANAGQTLDVSISQLTSDRLGASQVSGVSAQGTNSSLGNGDLLINGINISASKAEYDTASTDNAGASAIAKVEAINSHYSETGVKAYVNENVAAGTEMVAAAGTATIKINDVDIAISTTGDAAQTRAAVAEAINAFAEQTGVMATNSDTDYGGVTLTAEDGRNIQLSFDTSTFTGGLTLANFAEATGLAGDQAQVGATTTYSATYEGGFTLVADGDVSEIVIDGGNGTGRGDLSNAGLAAGTYARGLASTTTTEQTNITTASALGSTGSNNDTAARIDAGGTLIQTSNPNESATAATTYGLTTATEVVVDVDGVATQYTASAAQSIAAVANQLDANADISVVEEITFNISDYATVSGATGTLTFTDGTNSVSISLTAEDLIDYDSDGNAGETIDRLAYLMDQLNAVNLGALNGTPTINAEMNSTGSAIVVKIINDGSASIQMSTDTAATTLTTTLGGSGGTIDDDAEILSGSMRVTNADPTKQVSVSIAPQGGVTTGFLLSSTGFSTDDILGANSQGTANEMDLSVKVGDAAATSQVVNADSTVADIANTLNGISGVSAWEEVDFNIYKSVPAGTAADMNLTVGDTLDIGGVSVAVSANSTAAASAVEYLSDLADDINDTDFSGANMQVNAVVRGSGSTAYVDVTVQNYSGSDVTVATTSDYRNASLDVDQDNTVETYAGAQDRQIGGELKFMSDNGDDVQVTLADPDQGGEIIAAASEGTTFSGVNGLEDGDLAINGVAISASANSDDTASATQSSDGFRILSSEKSLSGIAIAEAINKVSEETGVTATVNETKVVGGDGSTLDALDLTSSGPFESGDQAGIYINGVELGTVTLQTDSSGSIDSDRAKADALNLINQNSGKTGVTAVDNGVSISLTAADGRNISIAIDDRSGSADSIGAVFGLDAGEAGIGESTFGDTTNTGAGAASSAEAQTYQTTYSTIQLDSASQISIEVGTEGADELGSLGLKAGTYGGGEDGQFLSEIDISTFEGAQAAITAIDNAIGAVASQRANLGAIQNRIESTVSNLSITSENLAAANSRIQDADFAAETAELSRTQVLQQAGISILAQANQGPQQVLSLLG